MCFSLFMVVLRFLNTTFESLFPNGCDRIGDGDGGQVAAIIESTFTDRSNTIGNNGCFTPKNKRVR